MTSLIAGFFSSKNKDIKMTSQKEKALQPWTVTELRKTHINHCSTLIKRGKHLYSIAQKACSEILTYDIYTNIVLLIIIVMSLLSTYSMGGF